MPLVRAGTVKIPAGHAEGRVRVIARIALPPLAAAAHGRVLAVAGARRTLNVSTASSRAYLARVASAQARAIARVRSAIPRARIGRRYRVILDGFVVNLPQRDVPKLVRLAGITRVYPSYTYTQDLNRAPSLIGADVIQRVRGADGTGVKIAVVDDGVDASNSFFRPSGFSYPAGFPRGGRKWTTPKVIVARSFPGPNSGAPGRLAVDPRSSFHGTHVAGIAAGNADSTAPRGADHPATTGLTGVAPRAWIGNYRVFNVPTPVSAVKVANTPEIVAAFESAVSDGMNVINFSGGGAQTDPLSDALVEAVRNVSKAGVVPVIAAGNDRDDFGTGSAGSPGTAPDAISVAAVSNTHVFAPVLTVTAPGAPDIVKQIPFMPAGSLPPARWGATNQQLVDVGSILGTDGRPVERHLCGPARDTALPRGTLPRRSLTRSIALVQRGLCPFVTKIAIARAAGAIGIVFADNREGEANPIPVQPPIPGGVIANLDGQTLVGYLTTTNGRTTVRIGREPLEDVTGRGGVVTSFSSAGPTVFGHQLKPDVSAPGGQILSSTLARIDKSRFAVFDGTSMATPHVAGAAALLLQLHPRWTPLQVKSALVSTAGAAWGNTARTREAPVVLEGGGLVDLTRAADPQLFTDPVSMSFGDLDTTRGAGSKTMVVRLSDASGGGTWQVQLAPQSTSSGTSIDLPGAVTMAPGGEGELAVVARAAADAPSGENYGFIVLTNGTVTRRIPYLFVVSHPALAGVAATPLRATQTGDTRRGTSRVQQYRYPTAPFGNPPDMPPMIEDGAEHLYSFQLNRAAANFGVAVLLSTPATAEVLPWVLGAPNEDQVQGFAGTPVNVNSLMFDYRIRVGAAGVSTPRAQTFYVAVDSSRDLFSGRSLGGAYLLRAWVNDVTPPRAQILTKRVAAGRPTIVVRTFDLQSGVDPFSLVLAYGSALVAPSLYDPATGLAVFGLPPEAPVVRAGKRRMLVMSSDYQETKNVNTEGERALPNTRFDLERVRVVAGPAVTWIAPASGACVARRQPLFAAASATTKIKSVRFYEGGRRIAPNTRVASGLAVGTWRTGSASRGKHVLLAKVTDRRGRVATASRTVRVCRK